MRCAHRACGDPPAIVKCPTDGSYLIVRGQLGKGGFASVYAVTRLPPQHSLISSHEAKNSRILKQNANHESLTTSSTTSSSFSTSFSTPSVPPAPPMSTSTTTTTDSNTSASYQIFRDIRPPPLPSIVSQSQSSHHHHRRPRSHSHHHHHSTSTSSSANYALKVISKCRVASSSAGQEALRSEVLIHSRLRHPSIVSLLTFWEDQYRVYLLLDLIEGPSLDVHVRARRRLSEPEAAVYISQTVEALSYLHANNVVHKDIKLANLILSSDLTRIHLCDFGLSAIVDAKSKSHLSPVCGTPNYVPPELLSPTSSTKPNELRKGKNIFHQTKSINSSKAKHVVYTSSTDIWSMGIVMYSMLVGCGPFDEEDVNRTFRKIRTARFTFPIGIRLSLSAKSLIRYLLHEDPTKRPSANEALGHPFFTASLVASGVPSDTGAFNVSTNTSRTIRASAQRFSRRREDPEGNGNANKNIGNVNGNTIGFRKSRATRDRMKYDRTRETSDISHLNTEKLNGIDFSTLNKLHGTSSKIEDGTRAQGRERYRDRERSRGRDRDTLKDVSRGKRSPSLMDENASTWHRKEDARIGQPNYDRATSLTNSYRSSKGVHQGGNSNHNATQRRNSSCKRRSACGGNRISGAIINSSRQQQQQRHGRLENRAQRASWTVANDVRKEVVNLCVSVSAALVKARKLLDEDAAGKEITGKVALKRAEAVCEKVDIGAHRGMVKRWLDYTSKYGFATLMNDGRVGCCFNDGQILFLISESERGVPNVGYVAAGGVEEVERESESEKEKRRKDISEKVCLLKMFAGLMMTGDVGGRGVNSATLSGLPSAFNMSLLQRDEDIILGAGSDFNQVVVDGKNGYSGSRGIVHVREWARLKFGRAAAFRLSNHTIHVKFDVEDDMCDDYVFDLHRKTVFYRAAGAAKARGCGVSDFAALVSLSETVYEQVVIVAQALNRFLE